MHSDGTRSPLHHRKERFRGSYLACPIDIVNHVRQGAELSDVGSGNQSSAATVRLTFFSISLLSTSSKIGKITNILQLLFTVASPPPAKRGVVSNKRVCLSVCLIFCLFAYFRNQLKVRSPCILLLRRVMQSKTLSDMTNYVIIRYFKNFIYSSIDQVVEHCKHIFLWLCYLKTIQYNWQAEWLQLLNRHKFWTWRITSTINSIETAVKS